MADVKLKSIAFAGRTLNVPHVEQSGGTKAVKVKKSKGEVHPLAEQGEQEHAVAGGNKVVFSAPTETDAFGYATVPEGVAEAILEDISYNTQIFEATA